MRSSKSIEDWLTSVKNVLHPAGFAIFSEINNETSPEKVNYASIKSSDDCDIFTYYPLSIDSEKNALNVSSVNLTVDTEFLETNPQ